MPVLDTPSAAFHSAIDKAREAGVDCVTCSGSLRSNGHLRCAGRMDDLALS